MSAMFYKAITFVLLAYA